jgi:hypothetical protein
VELGQALPHQRLKLGLGLAQLLALLVPDRRERRRNEGSWGGFVYSLNYVVSLGQTAGADLWFQFFPPLFRL